MKPLLPIIDEEKLSSPRRSGIKPHNTSKNVNFYLSCSKEEMTFNHIMQASMKLSDKNVSEKMLKRKPERAMTSSDRGDHKGRILFCFCADSILPQQLAQSVTSNDLSLKSIQLNELFQLLLLNAY
uniref:Uncharacterized protein n=1 Tax=Euplotes harpa TaxID=151035 RepID=A0A7S3NFA4_9SPIT|mmetsp:Transcript_5511/g.6552  ORF Transcript_5511/g.6552 Transcript_5511/m.6552 type:complete len:126 (+) Transcript_5511:17-394(+)